VGETRIEPARTAIVAIDFQPDIVGPDGPFAPMFHAEVERAKVIPTAAELLDGSRAAGATIVYSRAAFQPGYPDLLPNIPVFSGIPELGCVVDGTPGTAVIDDLAPRHGELVLIHPRVNAFHGTGLDYLLRGADINTVVLCGVATNLAIESAARDAADRGYRVVVVADACSTVSEAAHQASLASLAMFGEVMSTQGVLTALGNG
jgi:nicotinamidase-related amidase